VAIELNPSKTSWANPIASSLFFGLLLTSHLIFTFGGLKVNLEPELLSTYIIAIPGPYAATELTGLFYNK
jgi:tricarballylate dehydrogenase